ncbi:hypothetical protein CI238_10564 [Colletotrichum incanum]|uniref:Uncharacterized protein n=1 Tax=Colletotrichum incanum TaxID=1573173 RepID=A0A167AVI3_COLIC|nr:hypothetical protein CI238_10564 [Colletotrichum incanum]
MILNDKSILWLFLLRAIHIFRLHKLDQLRGRNVSWDGKDIDLDWLATWSRCRIKYWNGNLVHMVLGVPTSGWFKDPKGNEFYGFFVPWSFGSKLNHAIVLETPHKVLHQMTSFL